MSIRAKKYFAFIYSMLTRFDTAFRPFPFLVTDTTASKMDKKKIARQDTPYGAREKIKYLERFQSKDANLDDDDDDIMLDLSKVSREVLIYTALKDSICYEMLRSIFQATPSTKESFTLPQFLTNGSIIDFFIFLASIVFLLVIVKIITFIL